MANLEGEKSAAQRPVIHSCTEFLGWVCKLNQNGMLFRGVSKSDREKLSAESSILRRLRGDKKGAHIPAKQFINACKKLLSDAIMKGYDVKDGVKRRPLELLADLQHFGAATCLIDFTKSPLIALWFACRKQKHHNADGKIAAFNPESDLVISVQPDDLDKSIDDLLSAEKNGPNKDKTIRVWEPKHQNERITLQQSVFVFGEPEIKIPEEHECFIANGDKPSILRELRLLGISEESMFPDFDGYARILNAHDLPFHQSAEDYLDIGQENYNRQDYDSAIYFCTEAINKNDQYADAYLLRGMANSGIFPPRPESTVRDYTSAIKNGHDDSSVYYYRAGARMSLYDYKGAVDDYNVCIEKERSFTLPYLLRAFAKTKINNRDHARAIIEDCNYFIENFGNPDKSKILYALAYRIRGFAKSASNDKVGAKADFMEAHQIDTKNNPIPDEFKDAEESI